MVDLLQALGICYIAVMLYLTFLYYKKNSYSTRSFVFWVVVWGFGVVLLLLPESTSMITQRLNVPRVIDFYLILGLMFFSVVSFLSFAEVKKNEQKIEELVRKIALEKKRKK